MGRDTDGSTDRTLVSCDTLVNCHFLSFMNYSHYIFSSLHTRDLLHHLHTQTHTHRNIHIHMCGTVKKHISLFFFPNTIVQYKQKAPTPQGYAFLCLCFCVVLDFTVPCGYQFAQFSGCAQIILGIQPPQSIQKCTCLDSSQPEAGAAVCNAG